MRLSASLIALVLSTAAARAHVVPNMTIEADFAKDRSYTLRINLDPRVFLSDQPTSLPPVSADWYLSQTEAQKAETYAKATAYLEANLGLSFDGQTAPLPSCEFVALDGATYEAVKPETEETHLLATAKALVPEKAGGFSLAFGREANVSLILINGEEGIEERKPQVIFPGETSRPFKLTQAPAPASVPVPAAVGPSAAGVQPQDDMKLTGVTVTRVYPNTGKVLAITGVAVLLAFMATVFLIKRSKRQ